MVSEYKFMMFCTENSEELVNVPTYLVRLIYEAGFNDASEQAAEDAAGESM